MDEQNTPDHAHRFAEEVTASREVTPAVLLREAATDQPADPGAVRDDREEHNERLEHRGALLVAADKLSQRTDLNNAQRAIIIDLQNNNMLANEYVEQQVRTIANQLGVPLADLGIDLRFRSIVAGHIGPHPFDPDPAIEGARVCRCGGRAYDYELHPVLTGEEANAPRAGDHIGFTIRDGADSTAQGDALRAWAKEMPLDNADDVSRAGLLEHAADAMDHVRVAQALASAEITKLEPRAGDVIDVHVHGSLQDVQAVLEQMGSFAQRFPGVHMLVHNKTITPRVVTTASGNIYALDQVNDLLEDRLGFVLVLNVDDETGALTGAYIGDRGGDPRDEAAGDPAYVHLREIGKEFAALTSASVPTCFYMERPSSGDSFERRAVRMLLMLNAEDGTERGVIFWLPKGYEPPFVQTARETAVAVRVWLLASVEYALAVDTEGQLRRTREHRLYEQPK